MLVIQAAIADNSASAEKPASLLYSHDQLRSKTSAIKSRQQYFFHIPGYRPNEVSWVGLVILKNGPAVCLNRPYKQASHR